MQDKEKDGALKRDKQERDSERETTCKEEELLTTFFFTNSHVFPLGFAHRNSTMAIMEIFS